MRDFEVEKEIIKVVMPKFYKFMNGQTVGRDKNGNTDYYEYDVGKFLGQLEWKL